MRSHLPDPIIIHLEKRSLGLSETQIIPGKGLKKEDGTIGKLYIQIQLQ